MRHMRSRRILAMLLALSMIFGLLTTTAFAGEVDQNPSNVGESAANGTSEGGSGEGQSSGASEDESSKVTNKEDVPTEEETTPEEKKTTSSEEVDTQVGEEPTPVETQLTDYVVVGGIKGFEGQKFATFEAAYEAINPTVATLGLGQETPTNADAFDAVFADVDKNGNATLTYTITGNVTYDETNLNHLLTMGRSSSHYLTNERHLINFKFVGADANRGATLTVNSDITLPYEWWGEKTTTSISFENLTITGNASSGLYPHQAYFEGIDFTVDDCTLNGIKIYNCSNVGGSYTITNSTLDGAGAAKDAYAIHLQGHETAPLNITIRDNEISGYDRGINIDQKTAVATISNNEISVKDSGRSCIQLSGLAETTISGNTLALNGGNAFTLHEKLLTLSAAPEISISGNTITGTGYLIYDDAAANGTAFTADTLNLTYGTNMVDSTVDTTKGVKGNNVVASSEAVKAAVAGATPATGVATVDGVSYDTLDEALKYVTAGTPLTWVDESVWAENTPVYYAGNFYSNIDELLYYAQQSKGIITPDSTDEAVIYCRPKANITNGNFSHASYVTNTTIYGNGATLSGATEWDVENYYTLTKDITINIYNLNGGASVWGTRESDYTVTVNMIGCKDAHEVLFNYGSGNGQVIVTVKDCTFLKSGGAAHGWPVSINCLGSLTVDGCTFDGVTTGVVVNVKQPSENGKMAVSVTNSTFNNITGQDQNKGALRVTGLKACDIDLTIDNVKFTGTHADPEDITIGNVKSGENLGKVSYNISNTEGSLTAHKVGETTSEKLTLDKVTDYTGTNSGTTATKGTEANPYTLGELGEMTRDAYIAAQKKLGGTMYVSVGDYSYGKDGVLGNGVRNDKPGQTEDRNVLNGYNSNGYLGEKNDGANGLNIVFVNGSITSGVTGYTSIDKIGTSLLLAVPAYTNVTFKGITFHNVMSFDYQLYTGPWSQLGELKFDGCTFNGIIIGATAAQTLTFNSCTFNDYTNTTDANSSNPTWIRPAYGNWKESDNEGQGENFKSLTTINFTNNNVTSTRPVKFEFISQWNKTTTLTATGNTFDISAQDSDTETKNVGLYIGPHTDKNAVDLVLDKNTKSERTAALYVIPKDMSKLPVGSTVKDSSGTEIEITDALEWKTDTKVTLKTETASATTNVAKVGDTEYATLEAAVAAVTDTNNTITLLTDVIQNTQLALNRSLTLNLDGHTIKNENDIWGEKTYCLLRVEDNAVVTITGNGTVAAKKDDCYAISITSGSLTIENGTFIGNISAVQVETGSLTIKDGTFKQIQESKYGNTYVINCIDGEFASGAATVAIYGGTFVGFDPNVSPEKKVDGVTPSFAAPGVGITKNADGTFSAASGMTAQLLDADGNSVKAYDSLAEAIAAAEAGQTVTLLDNVTDNIEIATDKNFTLDLNGHTINGGTGTAKATIMNCGTVKITDSSTDKTGTIKRDDNGTVGETSYYVIRNIGTMTIEQAIVTNNSGYKKTNPSGSMVGSSLICNGDDDLGGTLNISGGKIEQKNFIAIKNGALGKLNVTGGTISSDHSAIQNWFDATITGGEINGQLWTDAYIVNESVGHTTIGGSAKYTGEIVMDIYGSVKPELEISGGTLDVTNWRITTAASKAGAKPAVSGGKFTSAVPENYCADGYVPTKNEDGTYGVKETLAAKIGDTEYETLAAAFAAAKDGETIVLLKDSSGDGIVVDKGTFTDKGLIVDFNNHSYTVGGVLVGSSGTASNGFQLNMDNKITFKNGTLYGDASVAGDKTTNWKGAPAILIQNYCDLTLENMTVAGGKETCYTLSNNCGNTLIKNSTITAGEASTKPAYQPARAFDVCGFNKYPGATVTVENSTINGAVEISNGNNSKVALTIGKDTTVSGSLVDGGNGDKVTVTKDKSVDVAAPDGYKWVDGETGQTLAKIVMVAEVNGKQYETLQAAIDAASKNQTVKLIADTTENVTMKTPYLTLDLNGHTLNGGQVKGKPALTVTARVTVKDSSADMSGTIMREDTEDNSGVSSHYVIDVQGAGWLTFESGNVINNSGIPGVKGASLVRVGDDTVAKYPGLNIKGGNFQQDNFIAIKVDRGDLFLNGGTITSKNSYAIENWHRATIKGGTVNGTVASWTYSGGSNSTTTITGGTINGNVNSVNYGNAEGKTAKVTISGGTVNGELDTRSYDPTTNELTSIDDAAKATIGVTGGTFSKDPTKYVVEGSSVTTNSDGTFGVEKAYLCKVGETKYYTMEDAFKAQTTSGEPIVLLRDYTTGSSFPSGSINRTVDLDGHTWTYTGSDVNSAAFEINYPNVTLTVKNGKVVSNSMVGLIPSAMGGTITYDNSGLVFESVEATANGNSGIETNGNNTNDTVTLKNSTLNVPNGFGIYFPSSGKLTIDNSKITAKTLGVQVCAGSLDIKGQNAAITVNGDPVPKTENDGAIQDGAAISIVNRAGYKGLDKITVTEGTFKAKSGNAAVKAYNWANQAESSFTESDKVAISGGSYSTAVPEDLCAEGFVPVTNGDGTYGVQPDGNVAEIGSVKYASLDEALKAAKDGETVKLLKDVEATQVLVTKGTLDLNGKTLKVSYFMSFSDVIDSTDGNGLIETGVQSFFTTNNSYLPLRDSAANGYRLFSYKLNKLGVVEGSSTAFWFNIVFGGKKAYSLLNTAGHNADLFIPMQIGSGNEWQYIKMNQSTLTKWTTPILNGTAPSKCGYYVNITGLDTLTSGTVLTLKTSIRSCGVEKLSDDSLTYTVK